MLTPLLLGCRIRYGFVHCSPDSVTPKQPATSRRNGVKVAPAGLRVIRVNRELGIGCAGEPPIPPVKRSTLRPLGRAGDTSKV